MKNSKKSWKPVGLLALAAVLILGLVEQSRAFTLIELLETQYVPAVQLVAFQSAAVNVTNISGNTIGVMITTTNGNGVVLKQKSQAVAPGATFTVTETAGGLPFRFSTTIALDTAQAAVSDVETFDVNTGQVMTVIPMVELSGN
jgi:hypothetical protein